MNYLIWSNKHNAWWGPERAGYFSLRNAGVYSELEALRICGRLPGLEPELLPEGRAVSIMIPAPDMDIFHKAAALEEILALAVVGKNAIERAKHD